MGLDKLEADWVCEQVAEKFNPEEIVDLLGLSSEELVEELRSIILDNRQVFRDYIEESHGESY